ncbi:sugar phosphate isomerase/epimerase family protein [Cohnella fermenti]|uniref:Sugar phosphate isomerase/epimerase n=1 Tax=Cohnella fermenti TaxID=2565925 RepID=A0A4S4BXG9_9BACL|nr:sugar phosphate isomerase/epimerase [Cohnella fermenti]THF79883.1 sugar phosphate isomerase/epimerase [Cohnella fermenti]
MRNKISVQLYTLREACAADFPGVLRELASVGYSAVQFAGFHGYDPQLLRSVLEETGLKVSGLHYGGAELLDDPERVIGEAKLFGTPDIVCAGIGPEYRNEEGYRTIKRRFNELAERVSSEGLRISYHNHAFEFETEVDGKDGLSYLIAPEADNLLLAEPDVYWLKKGGREPVEFLSGLEGRVPILHMKDMTDDEERTYAEVGTGIIDFESIVRWGEASGVEWYVVEQDSCKTNPLDCVKTSYKNLVRVMEKIEGNGEEAH